MEQPILKNQHEMIDRQEVTNNFQLEKLLQEDYSVNTKKRVGDQIKYFQYLMGNEYLTQCQKHCEEKNYPIENKLQNFKLRTFQCNALDFKDIYFIKFIDDLNLIFIFFKSKNEIFIYNVLNFQLNKTNYDSDGVTAMDWDFISEVFVFGHQSGKISFSIFKDNQFNKCFKEIKKQVDKPIFKIKLIYGTQAFCLITQQNVSELFVKFKNNNMYQVFHLLKISAKTFHQICSYNMYFPEGDKIKVFLSLVSNTIIFIIQFELIFDNGEIKELINLKILKKFQITIKREDLNANVLFEKQQEDQTILFYISTIDKLEIYQINAENQINIVQSLESKKQILKIFKPHNCMPIVFCNDFKAYNYQNIQNDLVKKEQKTLDEYLHLIQDVQIVDGEHQYQIFKEINSKGLICIQNQKFTFFGAQSWIQFFTSLLEEENFIEAIYFYREFLNQKLSNLVGVYFEKDLQNFTLNQQIKIQLFQENIKVFAKQIIVKGKELYKNKNYLHKVIGLSLDIIFKTQNFNFLLTDFLNMILNKDNFSQENLKEIIFHILVNLNSQNIVELSEIFFVKLFQFSFQNESCLEEVEKFLIFISVNYPLEKSLFATLKQLSQIYNLKNYNMLFFLTNPQSLEYFDYMLEKKEYDLIFDIFFDFWKSNYYFEIIKILLKNQTSLEELQLLFKMWFFMKYEELLEINFKKLLWISIHIHEIKYSYIKQKDVVLTGIEIKFSQIFQQIFTKNNNQSILIIIAVFKFQFLESSFPESQVKRFFMQILDLDVLKIIKANLNYEYFCQYAIKIYIRHRNFLLENQDFINMINENKNNDSIINIIYNEIQQNIEENFDVYLQKDWYFEILSTHLRNIKDYNNNKYVQTFKRRCLEILNINEKNFEILFGLLQISDKMEIIDQIKNQQIKKKLFLQISKEEQQILIGGGILQTLKFKCLFKPDEVIDFLNNNFYSIPEAIQICEQTNYKRGKYYLMYKQGMYQEAEILYKNYLKELWLEGSQDSEEMIKILIKDILLLKQQRDNQIIFYLKLIVYISQFSGKFELKREITKKIYFKIFGIDFQNLLQLIKDLNYYEIFLKKRLLAQYLLKNFQTVVDFNILKDKILVQQNQIITKKFLKINSSGTALIIQPCILCVDYINFFDNYNHIQFHQICKKMSHIGCQQKYNNQNKKIKYSSCQNCLNQNDLFLTQKNTKQKQKYNQLTRKTKIYKKKSTMIEQDVIVMGKMTEIDQIIYQEEKFQRNQFFDSNITEKKRGLQEIEYTKFYFDLFQLISNIDVTIFYRKIQFLYSLLLNQQEKQIQTQKIIIFKNSLKLFFLIKRI